MYVRHLQNVPVNLTLFQHDIMLFIIYIDIIVKYNIIIIECYVCCQGFVQNQNRLSNMRDRSILPDLCSSHRNQLVEMLKNHTKLREIKKKCRMAKEELSVNLHTRLRSADRGGAHKAQVS